MQLMKILDLIVVWSPIPVLVSGEMSSTFVEPCKSIYKELELYNQQKDIIDCNLMVGYVWADTQGQQHHQ